MKLCFASSILLLVTILAVSTAFAQADEPHLDRIKIISAKRISGNIRRETLRLPGWDPEEPVPAYAYYPRGKQHLPLVIYLHGLRGDKSRSAKWLTELAKKGFFVLTVDAYLHGERAVAGLVERGVKRSSRNPGIWFHQLAIAHTVKDISRAIDVLASRPEIDISRIGVVGVSMGGSGAVVLAWREPRISVVVNVIGAVDFWRDVTKAPPGVRQDRVRAALSPRVQQIVDSINPFPRLDRIPPKAFFCVNGTRDPKVSIESVRKAIAKLRPAYEKFPERLGLFEEKLVGHDVTDKMRQKATEWLVQHLITRPIIAAAR